MNDFIDPNSSLSFHQFDQLFNEHRLSKLMELARTYNATHDDHIDLTKYDQPESLIFSLWLRNIAVPEQLTFGYPYDDIFKAEIDCCSILFNGAMNLEKLGLWQLLQHPTETKACLLSTLCRYYRIYDNLSAKYRVILDKTNIVKWFESNTTTLIHSFLTFIDQGKLTLYDLVSLCLILSNNNKEFLNLIGKEAYFSYLLDNEN